MFQGDAYTRKLTETVEPGASIDELKELLRLDSDGEYQSDGYLEGLLLSATRYAEQFLNRAIITAEYVRQVGSTRPIGGLIAETKMMRPVALPFPPLVEVDKVVTVDSEMNEHETRYIIDPVAEPARLMVRDSGCAVRIFYSAGYGVNYNDVPRLIQQGILQHAAYMFNHRGDCPAEDAAVKSGAVDIYAGYKVVPV
jgi:uncharacterized phiE125 gp8 family phage protein